MSDGCKATPKSELKERLMNPCIQKTEIEHYARRLILDLETQLAESIHNHGLTSNMLSDYHKRGSELQSVINKLETSQQWQPIETAPKDQSLFLVKRDYDYSTHVEYELVRWDGWIFVNKNGGMIQMENWNGWQPLPAGPV